jgi:hypothetical protein
VSISIGNPEHDCGTVMLDHPNITWEKGCITVRRSNIKDEAPTSPTKHNYQITITVDEFRQMLAAFANPANP